MSTSRQAPHISVMSSVARTIAPWCGRGCARAQRGAEYATVPPKGCLYSPIGVPNLSGLSVCRGIRADMGQSGPIHSKRKEERVHTEPWGAHYTQRIITLIDGPVFTIYVGHGRSDRAYNIASVCFVAAPWARIGPYIAGMALICSAGSGIGLNGPVPRNMPFMWWRIGVPWGQMGHSCVLKLWF